MGRGMSQVKVEKPSKERLEGLEALSWPIWEKEASKFDWHYDEKETCYILEGEVTVTENSGASVKFGAGDLVTFAEGLDCVWEIHSPVRKHYKFGE